jgi:glycosyltransferase involved in cell wall biosynthesis
MRAAYVCADPGVPVFGCKGASVHVQEIVRTMVRWGLEVTLAARRLDGPVPAGLESVRVLPLKEVHLREAADRERALIAADDEFRALLARAAPIDLVYQRHSLWCCAAMEHAREAGIPSVLEVNAPLIEEQTRFRSLHHRDQAGEMERRAFLAAGRIACVSQAVAAYCLERGAEPARVRVVLNGVDPARFHPDIAAALPPEPGAVTIGMVSTLRPWHGVDLLVDAFARLAAMRPACRLLIVGDGPAREALLGDLSRRGLKERAVLTGAVSPESVPAWLTSMDIAVVPYRADADQYFSPLKLFESMAAGRAIVASRTGQVASVIEHGHNGLLCEAGDAAAMAGAFCRLGDDPSERLRLGKAARQSAVRNHSWDAVLDRAIGGLAERRESPLAGARR